LKLTGLTIYISLQFVKQYLTVFQNRRRTGIALLCLHYGAEQNAKCHFQNNANMRSFLEMQVEHHAKNHT